jgi:uncharacterized protein with PIN domain
MQNVRNETTPWRCEFCEEVFWPDGAAGAG